MPDLTSRRLRRGRCWSRPKPSASGGSSVILAMSVEEDAASRIVEVNRWLKARRCPPLNALATAPEAPMYGGSIVDPPLKELLALLSALSWRHRFAVQLLVRDADHGWLVLGLRDGAGHSRSIDCRDRAAADD